MRKLKLFSLALMAMFSTGLWAQTAIYASGYENGAGTWSGSTVSSCTTTSRTGSKSIIFENASTSAKNATQSTGCSQSSSSSVYCHVIGWAKAEGASTTAQIGFTSSKKSSETDLSTSSWTRLSYKGNSVSPSTIIIYKKGATTGVYFDDIVAYYSSVNTTDLTAPSAATSVSATTSSISWKNGEDTGTGATGIQNTLIWKRTKGSGNDLTLHDQGIYSLTSTEGPSTDQSGNWTLVTASVAAGTAGETSNYTEISLNEGDVVAIVHRDMAYNYSTPAYASVPVSTTYTVTINPNEGSYASTPEGWNFSDGKYTKSGLYGSFNVPSGLARSNKDLSGWKDGQGNDISLPITLSKDTTLVAQWVDHAASSDATLSALSITGITLSPAFSSATEEYSTASLPFYTSMPAVGDVTATKNDANAKTPVVTISGKVITISCEAEDGTKKSYKVTVNIADMPDASTSINIEQNILDNSTKWGYTTALTAAHISYDNLNSLDSLNSGDSSNDRPDYNEPFLGLKIKKSGGYIQMVVPDGETLKVKFGSVAADLRLTINEVAQSDISKSTSVYEHTASGNELIKIATSSGSTVVLKQIMIGEDIAVVRPFEAKVAPTTNGTASVELPKYAKGEQVTVNCTPATGYQLNNIAVSGFDSKGVATNVEVTDGKFTMPGSPVTITVTFSVATALDNTEAGVKAVKRLENGMLVIEKNGVRYNAQGQIVR